MCCPPAGTPGCSGCCSSDLDPRHNRRLLISVAPQAVRAWEDEYAAAREERAAALRLAASEQFATATGDAEADAAAGMFSIDDMGAAGAAAPPCSPNQMLAGTLLGASGWQGGEAPVLAALAAAVTWPVHPAQLLSVGRSSRCDAGATRSGPRRLMLCQSAPCRNGTHCSTSFSLPAALRVSRSKPDPAHLTPCCVRRGPPQQRPAGAAAAGAGRPQLCLGRGGRGVGHRGRSRPAAPPGPGAAAAAALARRAAHWVRTL